MTVSSSFTITTLLCGGTVSDPSGTTTASTIRVALTGGALGCSATGSITITAMTPGVTLTAPTSGSTFTTGQPEFQGTASSAFDAGAVTVNVYGASGSLAEALSATPNASGAWSVPGTTLPNGQYTAIAEQDDPFGTDNYSHSSAVTFVLNNVGPSVTLGSLGSKPLLTSTPTFTGTAGIRPQDGKSLGVAIRSGSSTSGPATATATGSVGSGGKFRSGHRRFRTGATPPRSRSSETASWASATRSHSGSRSTPRR